MNQQLWEQLQAQNLNVQKTETPHLLTVGCAIVFTNKEYWKTQENDHTHPIGIVNSGTTIPFKNGSLATVTVPTNEKKIPAEARTFHLLFEQLRFTGMEIDARPLKDREGVPPEYVPLFEYYITIEEIEKTLVKREEINQEEYYHTYETIPSINIDYEDFTWRLLRDEQNKEYWAQVKTAFALAEVYMHAPETVVLFVYYKETYNHYVGDEWLEYQPAAYFKQKMLVYTPELTALDIAEFNDDRGGIARPFYQKDSRPVV